MANHRSASVDDLVDDLVVASKIDEPGAARGELLNFRNRPADETDAATQLVELAVRLETGEVTKVVAPKNQFYRVLNRQGFTIDDVHALDVSSTTIPLPLLRTSLGTELATQTRSTTNWLVYLAVGLVGSMLLLSLFL